MSVLEASHPLHGLTESAYLRAVRQDATRPAESQITPVWFQRQAGRSLPEYRAVRGEGTITDVIQNPELAAEITLQPVRRYNCDAAVLFSDIIVPAAAVGFGVGVVAGVGPVAPEPFCRRSDLARLPVLEPEQHTPYVAAAVRLVVEQLAAEGREVPLIGFAGAPFTVASYLVEGRPSRDHARTKQLMHDDPALWHDLMTLLADSAVRSMRSQVLAGASAVQLFDTWAGALSPHDYAEFVRPHTLRVFAELEDLAAAGVPRAHFGVATGELLGLMASVGCEVMGVDWRVPLDVAALRISDHGNSYPTLQGNSCPTLQGNLDPAACLAQWPAVRGQVDRVLRSAAELPGHIFNLGHGVLPSTDPEILEQVVKHVHTQTGPGGEFDLAQRLPRDM